jgi:hypothetical protein
VTWTYASDADDEAQPRDRGVDREVASLYAALARAAATEANRVGDFAAARRALEGTAARIARYGGDDAVLHRIASELKADLPTFTRSIMSAPALKASFFAAEAVTKFRDTLGRARKRPDA